MPIHRPGQTVSETPSHVLTLPLEVEPWQTTDLDKTFEAARLLYNSLVRHFLKQYELYQNSRQYKISTPFWRIRSQPIRKNSERGVY